MNRKDSAILAPAPQLFAPCRPLDFKKIKCWYDDAIQDMIRVCELSNGLAIAANQIGWDKRVIVLKIGKGSSEYMILLNPEIVAKGDDVSDDIEGCLSLPGKFYIVNRPTKITYTANIVKKRELSVYSGNAEGILARILQHEVDHLDGVLISDIGKETQSQNFEATM